MRKDRFRDKWVAAFGAHTAVSLSMQCLYRLVLLHVMDSILFQVNIFCSVPDRMLWCAWEFEVGNITPLVPQLVQVMWLWLQWFTIIIVLSAQLIESGPTRKVFSASRKRMVAIWLEGSASPRVKWLDIIDQIINPSQLWPASLSSSCSCIPCRGSLRYFILRNTHHQS